MFAKLIFAIERDFLAIASFNMTLEFWLESRALMLRLVMALKVIRTAASSWTARHQAHEAGRLVWTCFVWKDRLVLERRTLTRHVEVLECRIKGCSQRGCIGESWRRLFIASEGDTLDIGQRII